MAKSKRRMAEPHVYVNGVESVALRSVPGQGEQIELWIKTREGDLVIRLLSHRDRGIRVVDLRPRDKKRNAKERSTQVPFPSDAYDGATTHARFVAQRTGRSE